MRGHGVLLCGRAFTAFHLQRGQHRRRQGHLVGLEIKPVAAAAIGDLEEQLVFAGLEIERHLVLIRRHATADFFVGHQLAIEPDAEAVIATQ